jgi:hypothetical protein
VAVQQVLVLVQVAVQQVLVRVQVAVQQVAAQLTDASMAHNNAAQLLSRQLVDA